MCVSWYGSPHDVLTNAPPGYLNMNPPQLELVIADCDAALALDRRYEKALGRRAGALESLGRYEESLRGVYFA